ncbi:MAG: biotin/lipoyl-containing protein, partial [Candidatus Sulfotelmatobacter sp.]
MPTDIIMPQMGESIVEGTITKWLKKPGDKVQRDEPLFEISTDKVDAEIPAPASGVLQEIKVTEGTTVGVNTVVGTIAVDGEAAAKPAKAAPAAPLPAKEEKKEEKKPAATPAPLAIATPAQESEDEEARSSPLVRKIAREHGVNLSQVPGTGLGGRITKQD